MKINLQIKKKLYIYILLLKKIYYKMFLKLQIKKKLK